MGNCRRDSYSAATTGVIRTSKALPLEQVSRGITVNCVLPELTMTDMVVGAPVEELLKKVSPNRLGQSEKMAVLAWVLFSRLAAYVIRHVLPVNGGMLPCDGW
ncbi:MAG: SDR family oxidoreductase [Gammaproteobacteria bacterium]